MVQRVKFNLEQPPWWLLLIHQIPQSPNYLRIRAGRLVSATGAVALKPSVYALPDSRPTRETFSHLAHEIRRLGGEATVCRAELLDGLDSEKVMERFQSGRTAAYAAIARDAKALSAGLARGSGPLPGRPTSALRRKLTREVALDFFGAPGFDQAARAVEALSSRQESRPVEEKSAGRSPESARLTGRSWVTRRGVLADRIASAWLVLRFIDPSAHFQFIGAPEDQVPHASLRFDMPGGDFTHEGDRCTFEVLAAKFRPGDAALRQLAEILHDIDMNDGKFGRPEAGGVQQLILGLAQSLADDHARIAKGVPIFDALYASFQGRRVAPAARRST